MKHRPCKDCPWRRDAPTFHWHPRHFLSISKTCRGAGLQQMACHKSTGDEPFLCAGWAAVEGMNAIGLRIAALTGKFDPSALDVSGLELYSSFDEMLAANGIEVPDVDV